MKHQRMKAYIIHWVSLMVVVNHRTKDNYKNTKENIHANTFRSSLHSYVIILDCVKEEIIYFIFFTKTFQSLILMIKSCLSQRDYFVPISLQKWDIKEGNVTLFIDPLQWSIPTRTKTCSFFLAIIKCSRCFKNMQWKQWKVISCE